MERKKMPFWATIGKVFKESLWEIRQSLGVTAGMAVLWCIPFFLAVAVPTDAFIFAHKLEPIPALLYTVAWFAIFNTLLLGPFSTALYAFFKEREEGYPDIKFLLKVFAGHYLRSVLTHLFFSTFGFLLVFNMTVAITEHELMLRVAAFISLYVLLILALMALYVHPLIALGNKPRAVIKKSFFLVMDNSAFSWVVALILCLVLALSILILPLLVIFYGVFMIHIIRLGFAAIWARY
jgi:uncharacterized membrane protein YesL